MSIFETDIQQSVLQSIVDQVNQINHTKFPACTQSGQVHRWEIDGTTLKTKLCYPRTTGQYLRKLYIWKTPENRYIPTFNDDVREKTMSETLQQQYKDIGIDKFEFSGEVNCLFFANYFLTPETLGQMAEQGINLIAPKIVSTYKTLESPIVLPDYVEVLELIVHDIISDFNGWARKAFDTNPNLVGVKIYDYSVNSPYEVMRNGNF